MAIAELVESLQTEFSLTPVMAGEIECYVVLADESAASMDAFWVPVDVVFKSAQLPILKIEKERGLHQYEVVTQVTTPARLAVMLVEIRRIIEAQAHVAGVKATFEAKPFPGQPSSGMHLHLHLADGEGINQYHKTEEWMSDALRYSLGGLLDVLMDDLPIFFPNESDFERLNDPDHIPKIAGWGVNNRYCALRIPMTQDPYDKRIEHRAPCANADPEKCIEAMLAGVLKGLRDKSEPPSQSYGKWAPLKAAPAPE